MIFSELELKGKHKFISKLENTSSRTHWSTKFHQNLIQTNNQYLAQLSKKPNNKSGLNHSVKKLRNVCFSPDCIEKKLYQIRTFPHGCYSSYAPIKNNIQLENEILQYFPYLRFLNEQGYKKKVMDFHEKIVQDLISQTSSKFEQKWHEISATFFSKANISLIIELLVLWLKYGLQKIYGLFEQISSKCLPQVLISKIILTKRYLSKREKLIVNFSISMQNNEEITLQNISKTMKQLYCGICNIYDCSKHELPSNVAQNNYQYVNRYSLHHKQQSKYSQIVTLLKQHHSNSIVSQSVQSPDENQTIKLSLPGNQSENAINSQSQQDVQKQQKDMTELTINQDSDDKVETNCLKTANERCSGSCYKDLNAVCWVKLQKSMQNKSKSQLFRSIAKLGIQLYDYNPCQMQRLFPAPKTSSYANSPYRLAGNNYHKQSEITCQDIYYYLIVQWNIMSKLSCKFYQNQKFMLLHQPKYCIEKEHPLTENYHIVATHKKQSKHKKHRKCAPTKSQNNSTGANHSSTTSICYHFFMDKDLTQEDISCVNCQCQLRGYCLPECMCDTNNCTLKRKGCKCKRQSQCFQNKCPCFAMKTCCLPGICQNCFSCSRDYSSEIKWNHCKNSQQQFQNSKLTRIGASSIKEAGLGLFAGQDIEKGSIVCRYSGQICEDSNLEQQRERFCLDNSFYNFKLSDYENLDARFVGNKARFMNHASENLANVASAYVTIKQENIIVFYALRFIEAHEELFFDYDGDGNLVKFKEKYPFLIKKS